MTLLTIYALSCIASHFALNRYDIVFHKGGIKKALGKLWILAVLATGVVLPFALLYCLIVGGKHLYKYRHNITWK